MISEDIEVILIFCSYFNFGPLHFTRQSHKIVKHNQAICWQQLTNCLSVFAILCC